MTKDELEEKVFEIGQDLGESDYLESAEDGTQPTQVNSEDHSADEFIADQFSFNGDMFSRKLDELKKIFPDLEKVNEDDEFAEEVIESLLAKAGVVQSYKDGYLAGWENAQDNDPYDWDDEGNMIL